MKSRNQRIGRPVCALVLAAGAGLAVASIEQASAVNDARNFLRWGTWSNEGALGQNVVIGQIEGGHPLPSHVSLNGRIGLQLSWPWRDTPAQAGPIDSVHITNVVPGGTRNWFSTHATAVASAMIGQGSSFTGITGIAPEATLLTSSIARGIDPSTGTLSDVGLTALAFSLFALAHQPTADQVADALGIDRYDVATVINTSFGQQSTIGRAGEDRFARIFNAAASMTGATLIASAGDEGDNEELDDLDPFQGMVQSPAAARNVIAVGRTSEEFTQIAAESSIGGAPAAEFGSDMTDPPILWNPDNIRDDTFPPPEMDRFFEVRSGIDIVAPGTMLRLAGSLLDPPDLPHPSAFSDFWSGTSFAAPMVTAAAALVHDIGYSENLWAENEGRPSALVTKAVLLNSAEKISFNNDGMFADGKADPPNLWLTTLGLDPEEGAGQLNLQRLFRQFQLAEVRDITDLFGYTIDNPNDRLSGYNIPTKGTNPRVPFVSQPVMAEEEFLPPPLPVQSVAGAGDIPAPAPKNRAGLRMDAEPTNVRLNQLGGGNDPPLGNPNQPGLGEGGFFPPEIPPRPFPEPGFTPNLPTPFPPGPTDPSGSARFRTGWDHGMIGPGFIDIPLGTVTPNSTITLTLCWNTIETWRLPDFAAPLRLTNPAQILTEPFRPGVAASQRAQAAPALGPALPAEPKVAPRKFRELGWERHTITADGKCTCGAAHPEVKDETGKELSRAETDQIFDRLFQQSMGRASQLAARGSSRGAGSGLDIVYDLAPQVAADPAFVAGLERAAQVWESRIADDVTLTVRVDFTSGVGSVIAFTQSRQIGLDYEQVRQQLVSGAGASERNLLEALPVEVITFLTTQGVISSDDFEVIALTPANARAIGVDVPPVPGQDFDAMITFNRDFAFDTNPDDGIVPGQIDLVYVMVHELGHMLGFVSGVDRFVDPSMLSFPTTLDLYRFGIDGAANDPTTIGEWAGVSREFRGGVESALDTVDAVTSIMEVFRFSTGSFNGDERQSSHWKDDSILGIPNVIGVMDPTAGDPSTYSQGYPTDADLIAMSLIGWNIDLNQLPELPPDRVPVIGFESLDADPIGGLPRTKLAFEWAFEDLNLELYRLSFDGSGNDLVAASRSVYANTEHISIGPESGSGAAQPVQVGQYTLRIVWFQTQFDFGGYFIVNFPNYPSVPFPGFTNLPRAQTEYGVAWYIDLERSTGDLLTDSAPGYVIPGDFNLDGTVDSTDLAMLLSSFGTTNPGADLNADGRVDARDLAILLGNYGRSI